MVTLNMWILPVGVVHPKKLVTREIEIFQEEFVGIDVNLEVIPWEDAWERITNLVNQKEGPDIIQLGSTWNGTLASLGLLKDITEFAETVGGEQIFVPAAWRSCRFPNRKKKADSILEEPERISSLPWFVDIRTLYYREDIFKQAGTKATDLETWDTFLGLCQRVQGVEVKGKKVDALGVSAYKNPLLVHNIAPWIWGAGGDFISPDGDKAVFNSDESLQGVQFFLELAEKGYISPQSLRQNAEEVAYNFCVKGDYVMSFSGANCMPTLLDNSSASFVPDIGGHCRANLFPYGNRGRFVFCGGSNLAITNFSPYVEEACNLIKFLVSFDSQNRYPKSINILPSLLESFNAVFITDDKERALKESWRFGKSFPNVPAWGEIEMVLIDCLAKIWDRIKQKEYEFSLVKKDLDEAAQKADELLAKWEVN